MTSYTVTRIDPSTINANAALGQFGRGRLCTKGAALKSFLKGAVGLGKNLYTAIAGFSLGDLEDEVLEELERACVGGGVIVCFQYLDTFSTGRQFKSAFVKGKGRNLDAALQYSRSHPVMHRAFPPSDGETQFEHYWIHRNPGQQMGGRYERQAVPY